MRIEHSVVRYDGVLDSMRGWVCEACVIRFQGPNASRTWRSTTVLGARGFRVDVKSVFLSEWPTDASVLLGGGCGVFGAIGAGVERMSGLSLPKAWGVVKAERLATKLPAQAHGFRAGRVLLAERDWYERETASGGRLSAVGRLEALAVEEPDAEVWQRYLGCWAPCWTRW